MSITRLNTELVAEQIKDHLDELNQQEMITDSLHSKTVAFRRLLNAINQADIDTCRIIKQEAQMVILVPEGTSEVFLQSAPSFINPTENDEFLTSLEEEISDADIEANQVILNREWFVDASSIRSQYIHAYSQFPKGNRSPAYKIKIVGQDMFDNESSKGGYNDAAHGDMAMAMFEAATKRLRFSKSFGADTYLSFPAYLMPSKINFTDYAIDDWNNYAIKAPDYSEQYLIYRALERVVPLASPAHQFLQQTTNRELQSLYTHIPQNTAAIEVTDGYIG